MSAQTAGKRVKSRVSVGDVNNLRILEISVSAYFNRELEAPFYDFTVSLGCCCNLCRWY